MSKFCEHCGSSKSDVKKASADVGTTEKKEDEFDALMRHMAAYLDEDEEDIEEDEEETKTASDDYAEKVSSITSGIQEATERLGKVATLLEKKGAMKIAYALDTIADNLDELVK